MEKAASLITNAAHPEANIIWGAAFDENLKDEMSITVSATGVDAGLVGSDPMDVPQNAATFGGKVQVAVSYTHLDVYKRQSAW